MICVPQLRCHEYVLPLHSRRERLLKTVAHLIFIAVYKGAIDVLVSDFKGVCDSIFYLAGIGLPGTKCQLEGWSVPIEDRDNR
jgi:hypothetical protein